MVHDLDEKSFKQKVFNYDKGEEAPLLINNNTVLEFWVTWCPHCQAMMPRYEKASEKCPEVDCYRIEMEQHPSLAEIFAVDSFPTFIFISPDGKLQKWVGEVSEEELEQMLNEGFDKEN